MSSRAFDATWLNLSKCDTMIGDPRKSIPKNTLMCKTFWGWFSVIYHCATKINYTRKMDLLSTFGFLLCVNYASLAALKSWFLFRFFWNLSVGWNFWNSVPAKIRHLKQSACAWFAIPCSSWVFMYLGLFFRKPCWQLLGHLVYQFYHTLLKSQCA